MTATDIRSKEDIRSFNDIRSKEDIRSFNDIRSKEDIRSFNDIRNKEDIRSLNDSRSAEDIRSIEAILSDIRNVEDIRSKKDIRPMLYSAVFALLIVIAPYSAFAGVNAGLLPIIDGELMIKEAYQVSNGENLVVSVSDADVSVETYDGAEAVIEVFLDGRNMDKARSYFEDQNFEVTQEGSNVYVKTYPKRKNDNWDQRGGANIHVKVLIPSDFNVNVKTADGDVFMDDIQGEILITSSDGDISTGEFVGPRVNIRTSDGDIDLENIDANTVSIATSDGDISLDNISSDNLSIRTSDGDISAKYLTGVTKVATSDGDIALRSVEGADVSVRTSDGEIKVDEVNTENAQFTTSDGNIRLNDVSGKLTAKTSDGNLDVTLVDATDITLRAGDGDVYIRAPKDYSADLYLKGERVDLSSRFQFNGTLKKNQADGQINGGRYSLEARSSGGRVVLDGN